MTCVAALGDECAFWMSDESANPDVEILNAVRPALATTQGPLIAISSPYARRGALWDTYKKHFGPEGDPSILVAQGATRDFNPDLPQSIIDKAMDRDPAAAAAEYMAQFRTDVEGFITREAVEACVTLGTRERPTERKNGYVCFVDPSGGSSDAFTLAIAHVEGKTQILDLIRERKPPFFHQSRSSRSSPRSFGHTAARRFTVIGMAANGQGNNSASMESNYEPAEKSKSDLYRDLLPLINSGAVDLLEHDRLLMQFTSLERRISRGGETQSTTLPVLMTTSRMRSPVLW